MEEKIKEYIEHSDRIIAEIEAIEQKSFEENDEGYETKIFEEIGENNKEIYNNIEKFEKNAKSVIGSLNEGVFIDEELTNRKGKTYYYRKGYGPGLSSLLKIIKESDNSEKSLLRLSTNKIRILSDINEMNKGVEGLKEDHKNMTSRTINFEKPIKIFLFNKRRGEGKIAEIKSIKMESGITLRDIDDDNISYYHFEKLIYLKFSEEINILKKEKIEQQMNILNKFQKINKELEEKGAKYLIAAKFL